MDSTSLFLSIPSEIRVLVYQFLFNLDRWKIARLAGCYNDAAGCCDMILRDGLVFKKKRWSPVAFINFAAILRTCHLINKEATPVLYEQTMFHMRIGDEQYARTMRLYAPLDQCAFLPRVHQIKINPDVRSHAMLLGLPGVLNDLVGRLNCAPARIYVEVAVSSGSLSAFPPTTILPIGSMMQDARWLRLLDEMRKLKPRVKFYMETKRVRNNIQGRLDQLIEAMEV